MDAFFEKIMKNTEIGVIVLEMSSSQNVNQSDVIKITLSPNEIQKWCIHLTMLQFSIISQIEIKSNSSPLSISLTVSQDVNKKIANKRAVCKSERRDSYQLILSFDELNYWIETSLWEIVEKERGHHIDLDVRSKSDELTYFVLKYDFP